MRLSTLILALFCFALVSCGGGAQLSAPEVRAVTYGGSDWQAGEIAVEVAPAADGWRVDVASLAEAPAETLLLELRFDDALAAQDAVVHCAQSELSLLAAGRPGGVGLGIIMPAGASIAPGELLSFTLIPTARAAAIASEPLLATQVTDLAGAANAGGVRLSWSYRLAGDYDQNSEVNIGDLSPLGPRLDHSTTDGVEDEADGVVDGDGNGQVNIADLTPIGANLLRRVIAYNIYSATGDDLASATASVVDSVMFDESAKPVARRVFEYDVTDQERVNDGYFFVAALHGDSSEGSASNIVHVEPQAKLFAVPPAGQSTIDSELTQSPSLLLLPGNGSDTEDGAPLVAYTTVAGELRLAFYRDGAWQSSTPATGVFAHPRLYRDGENWYLMVYNAAQQRVVRLQLGPDLSVIGGGDILAGLDGVPTHLAVDFDPASGITAVAAGVTTGSESFVYRADDADGVFSQGPRIDSSGQLAGLDIGTDSSGDQWLFYSTGSVDVSTTFALDYTLHQGTNGSGSWEYSDVAYPDSPLQLDLDFADDGSPRVAFMAARDVTYLTFTASLGFDGVVATYDGSAWSYEKFFTSNVQFDLNGFPIPTSLTISPLMNIGSCWAREGEISYTLADGDLEFSLPDFTPQSGALAPEARYSVESGGSFADTGYFTGLPGLSQSWDERGTVHGAAYLQAAALDSDAFLGGEFNLDSALLFWRK